MGTLADFRRQYPQYDDMSDAELADALHRKYYSDIPKDEFFKRVGVKPLKDTSTAAATPAARPAMPGQADTISSAQRAYQEQVKAQLEGERGFFGRMYDKLTGHEVEAPKAYTPRELAERQQQIRSEQKKLAAQASEYDKLATRAAKEYQNPNAPDRAAGYTSRAQAAREAAAALDREYQTITKTGVAVPEAQTTREILGSIPRGFVEGLASIPGDIVQLGGAALETAGIPGGETTTKAGKYLSDLATRGAEGLFGAPGEALQYDPTAQFGADVGGGVGSMGTFLTPGAVAKAAGVGKELQGIQRAEAIAKAARPYEYGIGTAQGLNQGIQDVQAFEERTGEEVSPGHRLAAYLLNAGLGATEVGVANRIFERIPVAQRGAALDAVANVVRKGTAGKVDPTVVGQAVARTLSTIEEGALGRIAIRGGEEALQEAGVQMGTNVIAKGLYDPNRDITEGAGYAGLVGGIVGGGLRGGIEIASALRSGKAAAQTKTPLADSPQVEQEYLRLVSVGVAELRAQNPSLTQRQAFDVVIKDAGALYDKAIGNIVFGSAGGSGENVDTGMDVSGAGGEGIPANLEPGAAAVGAGAVGEPDTGRLGELVSGVRVPDVGEGAGVSPLGTAAPAFDIAPIFEGKTRKERTAAAQQLVAQIAVETPELQGLAKNKYGQAANQMVAAALKGETFDPLDIMYGVAGKERPASVVSENLAPAPATEAPAGEVAAPTEEAPAGEPLTEQPPVEEALPTVDETATTETLLPPGDAPLEAFSGETVLQHGRSDEQVGGPLEGFTPSGEVAPKQRYGVEGVDLGGVFGAEGVYLASDPKWFTDMSGMYTPDIYDVSAPFENALVLTPDNIGSLPEKDTPWTGKEIADWAKSQGYDGIVVEGFDDLLAKLGAAQQPVDEEGGRAFKRTDFPQEAALGDLETVSMGIQPDPNYVTEMDVFRGYLRSKNVNPEIGQDQVFAFNPEKMKVLGKAKGPAERVAMRKAAPAPKAAPTGEPKVVSNGKPVVLTEAQKRTALAKAKAARTKMNTIQKRIARTNDTADLLTDPISLARLARGDEENWALLRGLVDTFNTKKWQTILPGLSTEDIFRVLKGRIEGLTEADQIIRRDLTRFETKEFMRLSNELEQVADFLKKYPSAAQILSDLEFACVAYQVDPSKAGSAEEYAANVDKKTKELKAELANATVGDTKTQKKLNDAIKRRFKEIEGIYKGVPGDERVAGWRDLMRPENGGGKGKEIFKLIRDGHRRDLEAKYNTLRSHLMETKDGEALDEALEKLEAQFKPVLDQTIYFPAMRFGQFYARIGSGVNSIFKMFETEKQRNQFMRLMEVRAKNAENPDDFKVTDYGDVADLRNNFQQVSGGPLKDVLELFDENPKDIGALRSQVFDLWLQTMSQGDMRRHMAPRKMRAGYSTDILKNYANFRRASISDRKRAEFGNKLKTAISKAKDFIKDQPDRAKLDTFVKEIELRTLADLMPQSRGNSVWEQAIKFGNKVAFYQYLANPKTALIQLTQLHILAYPMLAQKYGTAKSGAALAKYGFSGLAGFAASPITSVKNEDGSWSFNWEQPNLLDNPVSTLKQESNPQLYEVLSDGWQEGRDLNLFMDTFANSIGDYGAQDPNQRTALQELMRGRVDTAALRGTVFAFEAMGGLMHQMERVNREATYMAALELGYKENRKKGQSHAEAKKNAIEDAVATTLEATFDFSTYNKPRILTTPGGRLAGQFMSYPYMMSSVLVRNMYTAIKFGELEPGERLAAAQIATGALVNIGLYAGLTGIPLYGLFKVIGSMLAWLFDDDDQEGGLSYVDADGNLKATYDIDWWFRNVFIQKHFGPGSSVQDMLDLTDDQATLLARSIEKGPISALTDVDLSNSVALDFMFFVPKEPRADTPEGKIMEYTFSGLTGAFGNAAMDYIKAGKDFSNGYTDRALEKLPRLFGNIARANRFAEEGQLGYDRTLVGMDKDFWTNDKAILQAFGFASTEADQKQQQNYEAKAIRKDVEKARENMLNKFRKMALDTYQYGDTPEMVKEREKVMEEWLKFNQTYPTDVIGPDTLYTVQANAIEDVLKSKAARGVPMDLEKTPYLREILRQRVEEEERKKKKEQ